MSTYLAVGIVKEFSVKKRVISKYAVSLDSVPAEFEKKINLDKYEYIERENRHVWEIKDLALEEGNIIGFLEEQFRIYNPKKNYVCLENLKGLRLGEEIKQYACNKKDLDFRLVSYLSCYHRTNFGFMDLPYEMLCFFLDGPIIMECYNNLFRYFRTLINSQKEKYPIADCIMVDITMSAIPAINYLKF